MKINEPFSLKL